MPRSRFSAVDLDANGKAEILDRMRDLNPKNRLGIAGHHRVPDEERDPGDQSPRRRQPAGPLAHARQPDETEAERDQGARADHEIGWPHRRRVPNLSVEKPGDVPYE